MTLSSWFLSLPLARQDELRGDVWALAHAAFDAGREAGKAEAA